MSRAILITGATGKQGGAVVDALLNHKSSDVLLAVTRNANSASARRLAAKSSSIKIVEGDLDAASTLFASAKAAAGATPLWGVFSVQAMGDKKSDQETRQGKALIDEAIKAGVQHFVYSSVERGGDERSWNNPTPVPHFITKHRIEHHLRDSTADNKSPMGWTILRPVIFMDNLAPGFFSKVFLTMIHDTMGEKPLQWIATKDIGFFAAEAFRDPKTWNKKAIGLAGDSLTFSQLSQTFESVTGEPAGTTFGVLGKALKHGVQEVGIMVSWFKDEGYKANMAEIKRIHPDVMTMRDWLKESAFVKKQ
ncbi:NmrA-like family domain-containing protein [Colletotrichum tofieldiae]|uniref:NmrA-like family domain-containing protein n=1 Tax=Colletotrichum tofieldiae TaxID=708197 RepID=A0A166LD44_9PEZI|nr:NmrA-like family domain-containing protein [Colletotrichum tofieldiae]GKT59843.1 NmrA-like family domain-containing protein [Colletotrichum tofieldiae]GKT78639.1 NmrA-like family domain-containing protein [Colletotrichum tofieldiae]GKT86020.1 nmrA-like family domain-containing protein [Colletotrichum tofieldiae]